MDNPLSTSPATKGVKDRTDVKARVDLRMDPCAETNHHVAELEKQLSGLQQKIIQLESQLTALTNQYNSHMHEYTAHQFGFISKAGFNNISNNSLIPFVSPEKAGRGQFPNTSTPKQEGET
jgi:TolA-binding protein